MSEYQFEWSEKENARRCHLIDKKVQGLLSDDEADELERLQEALRHHINHVAPLPFDAAKRLHTAILQKQESKQ